MTVHPSARVRLLQGYAQVPPAPVVDRRTLPDIGPNVRDSIRAAVEQEDCMKRDMELIRQLLFYFEKKDDFSIIKSDAVQIPGYEQRLVAYHIHLMCEAGFLSCEMITSTTTSDRVIDAHPFRLTWEGHEFLDAARNDTVWNSAKGALQERGLSATYGVLKALLIQIGKSQLGIE